MNWMQGEKRINDKPFLPTLFRIETLTFFLIAPKHFFFFKIAFLHFFLFPHSDIDEKTKRKRD